MDWRSLGAFRTAERGEAFYLTALEYSQFLWQRRLAARAILCLDRAMGAELSGSEAVLRQWPMPYAAMAWFIAHTPADIFIGNPRVHFQHYADRMKGPRRDQRSWRAWACWALTRRIRPHLPPDPRHQVREPAEAEIAEQLARHGLTGEAACWLGVLERSVPLHVQQPQNADPT